MNVIPLLCLCIGIITTSDDVRGRPRPECWLQCGLADVKATITCTTTDCECKNENLEVVPCADTFLQDQDSFGGLQEWTQCQQLALHGKDIAGLGNKFFRWEKQTTETRCYFLDSCDDEDSIPTTHCAPFPEAPCVSGPSAETCDPVVEYSCGPATWDERGLHWKCLSSDSSPVSIYGSDKVPGETTCQTEECAYWNWDDESEQPGKTKAARVKCVDGDKWETLDEDGLSLKNIEGTIILPDVAEAHDALCQCETLLTDSENMADPGLDLLCDHPLTGEGGIEFGNTCTLLCDGHFVMNIECYLGAWSNTATYPPQKVEASDIKC